MSHDTKNAPKGYAKTLVAVFAILGLAGFSVVKIFGQTVSSKFDRANTSVSSEVSFGGGGGGGGGGGYDSSWFGSNSTPEPSYRPPSTPSTYRSAVVEPTPEPVPEVNPTTATSSDRFSTFAVDVDTASYTLARASLQRGVKPAPTSVRVEEFVNYFGYDYPSPESGAFGVHLEAAPSPFSPEKDAYLLRVGVQGKRIADADRKPVHLTFLVDVSGSMSAPNKLGLAKDALKTMVDGLGAKDSVALVTYAGADRLVLEDTKASKRNKAKIKEAIDDLTSGGGTAMSSGMELAYEQAVATVKKGHVSRVLVMSDGDANIGDVTHSEILAKIQAYVDEGVTMSTIGFGMGNYKDTLMEQLANKGNGNYYYIDSEREARRIFGEQVNGTLEVIAKDVKIQVEFNPEAVTSYRLIGYENRDIADEDFRNDAVDAGEIGAGHAVTAFYEVRVAPGHSRALAHVRVRAKKPDGQQASEQVFTMATQDVRGELHEASAGFQFGAAVVAFAERLRKSPHAEKMTWGLIEELASTHATDDQRKELLELVRSAGRLEDSSFRDTIY